ncbi:MAG: hypothetical protein WAV41_00805 [Microgenomates group bacterium]
MAESKIETRNEKLEIGIDKSENRIEQRGQHEGLQDLRETNARVPTEIKTWLQKIEQDPTQMKTVHDDTGTPMLTPSPTQDPRIILPSTRKTFLEGLQKTVADTGMWLSAFLLKIIKKHKGNVKFKQE